MLCIYHEETGALHNRGMDLPDRVRQILSLAVFSPTGDNCQPWKFRIHGNVVEVFHDLNRAKHALNTPPLASVIALGVLIEIVALLAANRGLEVRPEIAFGSADLLVPETWPHSDPWCRLEFTESNSKPPLGESWEDSEVLHRCTDRRKFHGVEFSEIAEIIRQVEESEGVKLRWHALGNAQVRSVVARAEAAFMRSYDYVRDTSNWVRLDRKSLEESRDGFSVKNLGQSQLEAWMFVQAGKWPFVLKYFGGLFRLIYELKLRRLLKGSGLVSFAVSRMTFSELILIGRAALRTWLKLERAGYGVQPLTVCSLNSWTVSQQLTPSTSKSKFASELLAARSILQIPHDAGWQLVWGLRVGKVKSPLPSGWRTLRRPPSYLET